MERSISIILAFEIEKTLVFSIHDHSALTKSEGLSDPLEPGILSPKKTILLRNMRRAKEECGMVEGAWLLCSSIQALCSITDCRMTF